MDKNLITLSQKELAKIQRRVDKLKASVTTHKHFLDRSSDECWGNPNADEKYEHYMDLIEIAEQREELLENIQESLTHVADCFSKLEQI